MNTDKCVESFIRNYSTAKTRTKANKNSEEEEKETPLT